MAELGAHQDEPSIPLELISARIFKTGVLNLSYAPAKD